MPKSIRTQIENLSLWVVSHPIVSKLVRFLYSLPVSRHFIPLFCLIFQVNQQETEQPLGSYHSIREFFLRRLREGAREICSSQAAIVSPADGCVIAMGKIRQNTLLQVKGKRYSLQRLLASRQNSQRFLNGQYLTIYMSPGKYHHVHAPFDCEIAETCRIDGLRYPVNLFSRQRIESLYCRNAREIAYLQTAAGAAALIMVGSCQVGSVRMAVDTASQKQTGKSIEARRFSAQCFGKGQEVGWFDFGSTVILLFEPGMISFSDSLKIGDEIRMGEKVGQFAASC